MNSLWYLFEQEFSEEVCKQVFSYWDDIQAMRGKVAEDPEDNAHIRNSKIIKCPYGSSAQNEFSKLLEPYITVANRECFGFNLNGFCEFQIAEYSRGDFYIEHLDIGLNDTESQRKLSVTLQLTDPNTYQGGDFSFASSINTPSIDSIRKQGSILVFPSFLPHSINKVREGKRYALVGWYEGKKWC